MDYRKRRCISGGLYYKRKRNRLICQSHLCRYDVGMGGSKLRRWKTLNINFVTFRKMSQVEGAKISKSSFKAVLLPPN